MSSAARAERRRRERAEREPSAAWSRDHEWEASMRVKIGEEWDGEPPKCYRNGPLSAIVSRDRLPGDALPRWHVSVSHRNRVPDWREMADAAHGLRPGVPMSLGVPPRSWWINVHAHVLHMWELRDEALIESWRAERRGDEPS